jgi:hypothetical protein
MAGRPNATGALSTNFQVGVEQLFHRRMHAAVLGRAFVDGPDMQMVVVPAMRIRATTDIATVNFTVFPRFLPDGKAICQGGEADYALLG